jgi:hypothetical protein
MHADRADRFAGEWISVVAAVVRAHAPQMAGNIDGEDRGKAGRGHGCHLLRGHRTALYSTDAAFPQKH